MRITVWEYGLEPILSIDPTRFNSEAELIKILDIQPYPDMEYSVRIEDDGRVKNFSFDGSDGLHILAVLCYRGMADTVFNLDIPAADRGYMSKYVTPEEEFHTNRGDTIESEDLIEDAE